MPLAALTRARRALGPLAFALVLALILYHCWFRLFVAGAAPGPQRYLGQVDIDSQFFPKYAYGSAALAAGRVPLWNPHELCGIPFLATAQVAVFGPVKDLAFLVAPPAAAMHIYFLLSFALTAVLLVTYLRYLGLGWPAAAYGAYLWVTSPSVMGQPYHPPQVAGVVFFPLIILAADALLTGGGPGSEQRRRRGAGWAGPALAAALALQFFGGYPEYTPDTAATLAIAAPFLLVAGGPRPAARTAVRQLVLTGLVALLLVSIQLLPTLEMLVESRRGALVATSPRYDLVVSPPLGLAWRVELLHRDFGIPALLLALIGIAGARGRAPFLTVGALASLFLPFWLVRPGVPLFGLARGTGPWLQLYRPFVAVLAACGLELALEWVTTVSRGLCAGPGRKAALGVVGAAVLSWAALPKAVPNRGFHSSRTHWPARHVALLAPAADRAGLPSLHRALARVREPARFIALAETTFGAQYAHGGEAVGGSEPSLMPARTGRLIDRYRLPGRSGLIPRWDLLLGPERHVLDLLNVVFIADHGPDPALGLVPAGPGLVRNTRVLPRAFLVHEIEAVPDGDAAFAALTARGFDPRRHAILEGEDAALAGRLAEPRRGAAERVRFRRHAPEDVEIEVDAASPALLVLGDSFSPGWKVSVDGHPARILRADYLFRATPVPAGHHLVRFSYRPASFRLGTGLSLAGLVLWAVWLLAARRRP